MQQEKLATLFKRYQDDAYLNQLTEYAKWTVPSLFPRNYDGRSQYGNQPIEHDYQSLGALLVNRMAAKLTQTLFPIGHPFFKINLNEKKFESLGIPLPAVEVFDNDMRQVFANFESEACKRLFINNSYASLQHALALLIVTGNALLYRQDNRFVVYSLHNYVVLRDSMGEELDVVIKESLTYEKLPKSYRDRISAQNGVPLKEFEKKDVYTRLKKVYDDTGDFTWQLRQEVDEIDMGVDITYTKYNCPYIVATWKLVNGDSYGRGHCEDYHADLAKLSYISASLTDYEIDMLKIINCVRNGSSDYEALAAASHGDWVSANPDDVVVYEGGVYNKVQAALQDLQMVMQRLQSAFLDSSNTRDAERVTAEEIRNNIFEADQMTGGVFSNLAPTLHAKTGYLLMNEIDPEFIIGVTVGFVDLEMLTGVQAIGRSSDTQKLIDATMEVAAVVSALQQTQMQDFDYSTIARSLYTNRGVPLESVFKSQEQLEQEAANLQAQQAMQSQAMGGNAGAVEALSMI